MREGSFIGSLVPLISSLITGHYSWVSDVSSLPGTLDMMHSDTSSPTNKQLPCGWTVEAGFCCFDVKDGRARHLKKKMQTSAVFSGVNFTLKLIFQIDMNRTKVGTKEFRVLQTLKVAKISSHISESLHSSCENIRVLWVQGGAMWHLKGESVFPVWALRALEQLVRQSSGKSPHKSDFYPQNFTFHLFFLSLNYNDARVLERLELLFLSWWQQNCRFGDHT